MMFAWATPQYLLENMALDQIIYYYNIGWETKQTEAKVHWGTYGSLMSESSPGTQTKKQYRPNIEELRLHPGYENAYFDENGKFHKG